MKTLSVCLILSASLMPAQEADRMSIPLTDPSKPATIKVEMMNGDITVRGYNGREVIIESKAVAERNFRRKRQSAAELEGLKRIDVGGTAFDVEERDNVVTVKNGMMMGGGSNITLQVPVASTLRLKTMTGTLSVDGVKGEVEANSMNGEVRITNTEGSVLAHSLNGKVSVALNRVDEKPMAFSTMNGDIDITLPSDTKARFKLKNDHGDVYSDFEMKLESTPKVEGGSRRDDGKYKVKYDRTVYGTVNGGGPEISFTTLNGQIKIRQKK
ncbi:MAG: DUF4097 family beta strand repeat protein [Bryobacteraceae bacterium]|nr:DUF4097 family beta strand repeat protein [Bryobacteraceae bacterium]